MAKSKQTYSKKEKEKARLSKRKAKEEKKEQRKAAGKDSFEDMIAYVDEFGQLSSTPPDPKMRSELKIDDIQLGARSREASDEPESGNSGRVTYFNNEKGYGFIKHSITKESLFFHTANALSEVKVSDLVTFEVNAGPKGPTAVSVKKV
jgi:cold shock CspA family protein